MKKASDWEADNGYRVKRRLALIVIVDGLLWVGIMLLSTYSTIKSRYKIKEGDKKRRINYKLVILIKRYTYNIV